MQGTFDGIRHFDICGGTQDYSEGGAKRDSAGSAGR